MPMTPEILDTIAQHHGTPVYVYDLDRVTAQYHQFRNAFELEEFQIRYAMKANYNPSILKTLRKLGAGIDAVSPGDVIMARACGFHPDQIIYTANNITDDEMIQVQAMGVLMNIGSLSRLEKFGRAFPGSRVCLRFNPDVVDGAHDHIRTGGALTKFGILLEDAPRAADIAARYDLTVVGIHEHTGSGLQSQDSIPRAMAGIFSIARPHLFPHLEFLDFGGGFKVPYAPEEEPFDMVELGRQVTEAFTAFCQGYGRQLNLIFEPGKYLTAQAGVLLTRVNTIKENRDRIICGTDSGFPQLIRPLLYQAYHEIENLTHPEGKPTTCDVCGNICESGDVFARDRAIPEIREGDLLAVKNAGAYCHAMGGVYNLRAMPPEVVVDGDEYFLSRKGLSPEELVQQICDQCPDFETS